MSDLTVAEGSKLVKLFQMEDGYVLDFFNRSFTEFFGQHRVNIDHERYHIRGGSKGRRMRAFWKLDSNHVVGRVINSLIEYGEIKNLFDTESAAVLIKECREIAERLLEDQPVNEINALIEGGDGQDFEAIVKHIRHAIDTNHPEAALDRLHTYLMKYMRQACRRHGIEVKLDSALHAVFGVYTKQLRAAGHIESRMTTAILRETGKVLEAFNEVRNNRSFAHDNDLLNYEESMLILNHVAATVRFLNALEATIQPESLDADETDDFALPF